MACTLSRCLEVNISRFSTDWNLIIDTLSGTRFNFLDSNNKRSRRCEHKGATLRRSEVAIFLFDPKATPTSLAACREGRTVRQGCGPGTGGEKEVGGVVQVGREETFDSISTFGPIWCLPPLLRLRH